MRRLMSRPKSGYVSLSEAREQSSAGSKHEHMKTKVHTPSVRKPSVVVAKCRAIKTKLFLPKEKSYENSIHVLQCSVRSRYTLRAGNSG